MNFVNLAILKYKIKLKILILARNNNHEAELKGRIFIILTVPDSLHSKYFKKRMNI